MDNLNVLYNRIRSLSVFRDALYTEVIDALVALLRDIIDGDTEEAVFSYGCFTNLLYAEGGDLGNFVKSLVLKSTDPYVMSNVQDAEITDKVRETVEYELETLSMVAGLTSAELREAIGADIRLPDWSNSPVSIRSDYYKMIESIPVDGYGMFRNHIMFKVEDGELIPVEDPSFKPLDKFYGYERERADIIRNTEVLAEGGIASNVLLYGDAGTGKSSTVKACAAAFADRGVRLVEFKKTQVSEIPEVAEPLRRSPLKFIFYVDDLSFTDNDDDFYAIKGILEGSVNGESNNIVIYATSNRRHLIRESMEDRQGDDIHLNDTLQEMMSVSARFGLTVTFQKPRKDLYLDIVKELADEYGLEYEEEDLFRRAESFAIRANGRSPRTAKQFVILACGGMR